MKAIHYFNCVLLSYILLSVAKTDHVRLLGIIGQFIGAALLACEGLDRLSMKKAQERDDKKALEGLMPE